MKLFFYFFSLICYGQTFEWGGHFKHSDYHGTGANSKFVLDSQKNVYIIGTTATNPFDLNPNIDGEDLVYPTGISTFMVKLNSEGVYEWGVLLENSYSHLNIEVVNDNQINIYFFKTALNTTNNWTDTYMSKFTYNSSGTLIEEFNFLLVYGFNDVIQTTGISFDNDGSYYNYGYVTGNVIINGLDFNNVPNQINYFVIKYSSNNQIQWVKKMTLPSFGGLYFFNLEVEENSTIHIGINSNGFKIYKLNHLNGNSISQFNLEFEIISYQLLNDKIVLYGSKDLDTIINVGIGSNNHLITGPNNFIVYYDSNYNLEQVFTINQNYVYTLSNFFTNEENELYICGYAENTFDFNLHSNATNLINLGFNGNAFIIKLSPEYEHIDLKIFGQPIPFVSVYDTCSHLAITNLIDLNEELFISGSFMRTCDFDMSSNSNFNLNSVQGVLMDSDGFIAKYTPCNQEAPIVNNNQIFCTSTIPTISNLLPNNNSYVWYDSLSSTSPLDSNLPLQNGMTYYCAKVLNNCPESDRAFVLVSLIDLVPKPNLNDVEFCQNENPKISDLIGSNNFNVYIDQFSTSPLNGETFLTTGEYYISQYLDNCESERILINVLINNTPLPNIINNQTFCAHQNATLSSIVTSGQNIKWYYSPTGITILNNLTPLIDGGIYYATQTLGNCESERVPVFINIQNTPPAQGNNTQTFCSLTNPTINDLSVYGTSILWYSDLSSLTPLPLNTILTTESYYYATQTVNGCESQQRLEIYVILNEGLNATDFEDFICFDSIISINISNYNVNFISNFINYSFEYYTSLIGANIQNENDKIIHYSNFPLNFGRNTIFVRINSQDGCHQIVQLNINHYRNPIISINDIEVVCNNQPLTLNAGIGFDTYLWSTGSTNQNITITEPGFYSVSVTKNHNDIICSSSKNFEVVLSEIPVISEILTFDWTDNNNYIMAILSNLNSNNFLYSIDGINYQNSSNFYDLKNGLYTLYVKDIYDCGTVSKLFYLLMYPKYFTPNNDGYNDRWKIKFSELENDLIIEIFDRYGKLLNVMNSKESWNGTYNGIELPSSDYWFVVKRQNGVIHKGHFTLKR